jgi:hypothetical protein
MFWQIQSFPACTHHVFLSHCREDREWLVFPLNEGLQNRGILTWLDRHDYPYGRTSYEALRDGVLQCRHTVFLITGSMLEQPRGWGLIELAWADLLQENLRTTGGTLQNIILPLFFLAHDNGRLPRSAWHPLRDRAVFHHPRDGDALAWALRQIEAFVIREMRRAQDLAMVIRQDKQLRSQLTARGGLIHRVTGRKPALIPLPPDP